MSTLFWGLRRKGAAVGESPPLQSGFGHDPFGAASLVAGAVHVPLAAYFSNVAHYIAVMHPLPSPPPERKWARCQIALRIVASCGSWVRFVISRTGRPWVRFVNWRVRSAFKARSTKSP